MRSADSLSLFESQLKQSIAQRIIWPACGVFDAIPNQKWRLQTALLDSTTPQKFGVCNALWRKHHVVEGSVLREQKLLLSKISV